MEMIIFIGAPASGKSTFYRENFFNTHMRISMDLLNTRNKETRFLDLALSLQQRLVIDNTNVRSDERQKYIVKAKTNRYAVVGYYFESMLSACIDRNEQRQGKDRIERVGVIAKYKQIEVPSHAEGFDELFTVRIEENRFVTKTIAL